MGSCCNASGCDYYIVLTLLFYSFLLTVSKKKCNEEFVNNCYQQYNHNTTLICPEVKKLRMCISELTGCHAMKHPKFVQSRDILEKHRDCFFVNYSRILEVLKNKGECAVVSTLFASDRKNVPKVLFYDPLRGFSTNVAPIWGCASCFVCTAVLPLYFHILPNTWE